MRNWITHTLALALLVGSPAAAAVNARSLHAGERTQLQRARATTLGELRAGAPALRPSVRADERVALREAQRKSPELSKMRAGEIDTNTLIVILVVVAVIIVLL